MKAFVKLLVPVVLLTLAACAKDKARPDDSSSGSSSSGSSTTSPYSSPSAGSMESSGGSSTASASLPTGKIVYFQFDSSELSGDGQAVVAAWGTWLAANPSAKLRLEGHCDERGTREYNVALGERRANAVLQALTARGVAERQISISSFGEERPVALGHDEAAWAQNRRVEIVQ